MARVPIAPQQHVDIRPGLQPGQVAAGGSAIARSIERGGSALGGSLTEIALRHQQKEFRERERIRLKKEREADKKREAAEEQERQRAARNASSPIVLGLKRKQIEINEDSAYPTDAERDEAFSIAADAAILEIEGSDLDVRVLYRAIADVENAIHNERSKTISDRNKERERKQRLAETELRATENRVDRAAETTLAQRVAIDAREKLAADLEEIRKTARGSTAKIREAFDLKREEGYYSIKHEDPLVEERARGLYSTAAFTMSKALFEESIVVNEAEGKEAIKSTLGSLENSYLSAGTPAERNSVKGQAREAINDADWQWDGYGTQSQRDAILEDWLSGVQELVNEKAISKAIERSTHVERATDLEEIIQELEEMGDDGKPTYWEDLDAAKRLKLIEDAKGKLQAENNQELGRRANDAGALEEEGRQVLNADIRAAADSGNLLSSREATLLDKVERAGFEKRELDFALLVVNGALAEGTPLDRAKSQDQVDLAFPHISKDWPENPENADTGNGERFVRRALAWSAKIGVVPTILVDQIRAGLRSTNPNAQSWSAGALYRLRVEAAKIGDRTKVVLDAFEDIDLERAERHWLAAQAGMRPEEIIAREEAIAQLPEIDKKRARTDLALARQASSDADWLAEKMEFQKEHIPQAMLAQYENLVSRGWFQSSDGRGNRDLEQTRGIAWSTIQRQWKKSSVGMHEGDWMYLPPDLFHQGPFGGTEWIRPQLRENIREFFHDQMGVTVGPDPRSTTPISIQIATGMVFQGSNIEERIERTREHIFGRVGGEVDIEFLRGLEEALEEGNFTVITSDGTRFFGDAGPTWTAQVIVNGEPYNLPGFAPDYWKSGLAAERAAEKLRLAQIHDPETLPSRIEAHGTMSVALDAAARTTGAGIDLAAEFAVASWWASNNVAHELHIPQAIRAVMDGVAAQELGEGYLEQTEAEFGVVSAMTRAAKQWYIDENQRQATETRQGRSEANLRRAAERARGGLADLFSSVTDPWSYEPVEEGTP